MSDPIPRLQTMRNYKRFNDDDSLWSGIEDSVLLSPFKGIEEVSTLFPEASTMLEETSTLVEKALEEASAFSGNPFATFPDPFANLMPSDEEKSALKSTQEEANITVIQEDISVDKFWKENLEGSGVSKDKASEKLNEFYGMLQNSIQCSKARDSQAVEKLNDFYNELQNSMQYSKKVFNSAWGKILEIEFIDGTLDPSCRVGPSGVMEACGRRENPTDGRDDSEISRGAAQQKETYLESNEVERSYEGTLDEVSLERDTENPSAEKSTESAPTIAKEVSLFDQTIDDESDLRDSETSKSLKQIDSISNETPLKGRKERRRRFWFVLANKLNVRRKNGKYSKLSDKDDRNESSKNTKVTEADDSNTGNEQQESSDVIVSKDIVVEDNDSTEVMIEIHKANWWDPVGIHLDHGKGGIIVSKVEEDSPFRFTALQVGMRIVAINGILCPRSTVVATNLLAGATGNLELLVTNERKMMELGRPMIIYSQY